MNDRLSSLTLRTIDFADLGKRSDLPPELAKELDLARQAFAAAAIQLAQVYAEIPEIKNGDTPLTQEEAFSNDTSRIVVAAQYHLSKK